MTTTTSSSRNPIKGERLFDRTFARLLAATLRQNGLTMGIYGVCLILVTVCPAFLEAKNYVEGSYLDAPELLVSSWFYGASALIVPVLLAAMLFHYLHNRLSVDFYHAMPLSRKKLFFSRYFVGIVFLLVPLLVSRLLCTVVHLAFYTGRLTAGQIVSSGVIDLLVWAALHVIVFTFSCMVAVTTSNAVESIVYSGAVNGALAAIYFIFVSYSYNLYGISELPDWGLYLSPYGLIGRCMLPNNSWNYSTGNLVMVLVWLLIALAAIPLTLRLYNRFQSEWAQQWGRQSAFSQLMKVLAGFLVSFVLCMTLFSMLFDNILPNSIAAALVGGPIGFLIVEGITGKGFQNLRRSGKYILATVALCLSCTLFLATGGFGMVSRVPSADRVEEVELHLYGQNVYFERLNSNVGTNEVVATLSSPEAIDLVLQLHQAAVEEGEDYQGLRGNHMKIEYTLSPFDSSMSRDYSFAVSDLDTLRQLLCLPEVVEQIYPPFTYQVNYLETVTCYDKLGLNSVDIPAEDFERLLEAIRTDLLAVTPENYGNEQLDPVVGYLDWNLKNMVYRDEGAFIIGDGIQAEGFGNSSMVLRASYQNTLAIIEELGFHPNAFSLEGAIAVSISEPDYEELRNIGLLAPLGGYYFEFGRNVRDLDFDSNDYLPYTWDVTDLDMMEEIIRASVPDSESPSCMPIYVRIQSEEAGNFCRRMYIENSTLLSILEGSGIQVPYLLSAQEIDDFIRSQPERPDWAEQVEYMGDYVLDEKDLQLEENEMPATPAILNLENGISVAEYAREHNLDWFTGKTSAQLEAMEYTVMLDSTGHAVLYWMLVE